MGYKDNTNRSQGREGEPSRGAELDIDQLGRALRTEADPSEVEAMVAYMKGHFDFLGIRTPQLRAVAKPIIAGAADATADDLVAFADACWKQEHREFQYVATILLRRWVKHLDAANLADLQRYVTRKSWWDTVDSLAAWSVGPLVAANPGLTATMDAWIDHENIWLARTAILHQLSYKSATDAERLFHYVAQRGEDKEFFIRKALGWALRQYAREDPEAVRDHVLANEHRLSGLTVREALKHIGREPTDA